MTNRLLTLLSRGREDILTPALSPRPKLKVSRKHALKGQAMKRFSIQILFFFCDSAAPKRLVPNLNGL